MHVRTDTGSPHIPITWVNLVEIPLICLVFPAVGFVNGAVRLLDAISLQDEVAEPFRYARDAITHVEFSHDSKYLATAVSWHFVATFTHFFFLYILPGARFQALSAGVHCTLPVAGWKPTINHIKITVGFYKLHKGWLSLHMGHPFNVPIRRTMNLSSVIPANDTRKSIYGLWNFPRLERESNLGPLAYQIWATSDMSHEMRFPAMWYVRPAKPQISLHIRPVWSEPLLVDWIFYDS